MNQNGESAQTNRGTGGISCAQAVIILVALIGGFFALLTANPDNSIIGRIISPFLFPTSTPTQTPTVTPAKPSLPTSTPVVITLNVTPCSPIDQFKRNILLELVDKQFKSGEWGAAIQKISEYEKMSCITDLGKQDPELAKRKSIALVNDSDILVAKAMNVMSPERIEPIIVAKNQYASAVSLNQENRDEAYEKYTLAWLWEGGHNNWGNSAVAIPIFEEIRRRDRWGLFTLTDDLIKILKNQ